MNVPLLTLRRLVRPAQLVLVASLVAVTATVVAAGALASTLDGEALRQLVSVASGDPTGWLLAFGAFGSAFMVRALAWSRLLPSLPFGQSLAALHVALGANHVLPFRLGEPFRVISAVRRTNTTVVDATSTGVALRLGDVLALLVIGAVLGPRALLSTIGWAGGALAALVTVAALVAVAGIVRRAARSDSTNRPDSLTALLTLSAWGLESVLVWQVAQWGGFDLSWPDALLVTVIAIAAQLVAIAPGGIGTYEAAAVAALILVGSDPGEALAIALAAHALKTLSSLITAGVFLIVPSPSLFGRLRLPSTISPAAIEPIEDGPVVLFLPAFEEGPRIAEVIERAPNTAGGRPLQVLVVDDGSTDTTVSEAKAASAIVVSHAENRGLGRAVATGLQHAATELGASVVVFCDADGEYDPADIDDLVLPILRGEADYVIGSRFAGSIEHMRPHRRFGNLALTRWVRWMTRTPVTDGQSGYRALSRQAALATDMVHDYNYAQVLTIDLLQRGFRYGEVPITYRFRESGDSFVKLPRYLRNVVPTVLRQLNNPSSSVLNRSILNDVLVEPVESV